MKAIIRTMELALFFAYPVYVTVITIVSAV